MAELFKIQKGFLSHLNQLTHNNFYQNNSASQGMGKKSQSTSSLHTDRKPKHNFK